MSSLKGRSHMRPMPFPSLPPSGEGDTIPPVFPALPFRGRGDPQHNTRTRHPSDDQVGLGQRSGGQPGAGEWGPHSALSIPSRAPTAPLSPESSTTARGTVAPAPPPPAARSSPRPTRRMCASFTKVCGVPRPPPSPSCPSGCGLHRTGPQPGQVGRWDLCAEDRLW